MNAVYDEAKARGVRVVVVLAERAREDTVTRFRELAALYGVKQDLAVSGDLDFRAIAEVAERVVNAAAAAHMLADE